MTLNEGQTDPSRADSDEQAEARMMRALSMMSAGAPNGARGGTHPERSPFERSQNSGANGDRSANDRAGAGRAAIGRRVPAGVGNGGSAAGSRRHRFVQDGEVPVVTVARPRRDPLPLLAAAPRADADIANTAGDLASERAARVEAERRAADLQVALRSHQTRLGDAEMARDAAENELRELRVAVQALQAENAALLAAPRRGAEIRRPRPRADAPEPVDAAPAEPEPVKWWA